MADAVGIWDVRYAVQENTLRRGVIGDEDLRREIEDTGRGWVVDDQGRITAFAIGNAVSGNIWALFVHPDVQGPGPRQPAARHDGRLAVVAWPAVAVADHRPADPRPGLLRKSRLVSDRFPRRDRARRHPAGNAPALIRPPNPALQRAIATIRRIVDARSTPAADTGHLAR
jgi:hypothetical protein